jgi:ribonuclease-3
MNLESLQDKIGYRFEKPELLLQAVTHRSHGNPHNERLEFLGDGVLNCVVAHELFSRFPRLKEGDLSRLRANLVRQESLHQLAQSLDLGDALRLGDGELKSGGHARPSILADAVEAVFGAVFVDGGFAAARAAIERLFQAQFAALDPKSPGKDAKTLLQELMQSRHLPLPAYAVVSTEGAAHNQRFEVECAVQKPAVRASGFGASRRAAEQDAAMRVFNLVRK